MKALTLANFIIGVLFTLCYAYQILYMILAIVKKPKPDDKPAKKHRYAVLISARNEAAVIGQLIESIAAQKYPKELVSVFVVADNCSDSTAEIARQKGATVYERFDTRHIGKGYALKFLLGKIDASLGYDAFDGYFVFDADNLLEETFIDEMNKVFDRGYRVITSYRNSKNYGTNWISSGYALWFIRDCKFLNNARMLLHTSSSVAGTGFLMHRDIVKKNNGWKHFTLTEDTEFTIDCITHGEEIAYCNSAILYDEQPVTFRQSWNQRLRWAKGYVQVFLKYWKPLLKGVCRGNFACLDMILTYVPAIVLTFVSFVLGLAFGIASLVTMSGTLGSLLLMLLGGLGGMYLMMFFVGLVTGVTEWKRIHCSAGKKILSFFTFPLFMITYIPVSITALFKRVEWSPIQHTASKTLDEVRAG